MLFVGKEILVASCLEWGSLIEGVSMEGWDREFQTNPLVTQRTYFYSRRIRLLVPFSVVSSLTYRKI